jgi:hypothetical protein
MMPLTITDQNPEDPLHITGRVVRPPEVRFAIEPGTMRTVPMLQLELQVAGQVLPIMVRQAFPFHQAEGAHAAARRYKQGSIVSVDAAWACVQVIFQNVSHIQLIDECGKHYRGQAASTGEHP